jgi:hypothetical protein
MEMRFALAFSPSRCAQRATRHVVVVVVLLLLGGRI